MEYTQDAAEDALFCVKSDRLFRKPVSLTALLLGNFQRVIRSGSILTKFNNDGT